ncbi:MAG: ROK family protein [Candidatus Altiarchaeota archaeon]
MAKLLSRRDVRESFDSMEGVPERQSTREASVSGGVDIGGKLTKVTLEAKDGRRGEAIVPTYRWAEGEPIPERVSGLARTTKTAVLKAAESAGIRVGEIDALGLGAPGRRNPATAGYMMPNAIGRDGDGRMVEVDFERALRAELSSQGFRSDAVIRGGNDCDVAAAATRLDEVVVVQKGVGEMGKLSRKEKSLFLLLGTGIGGGEAQVDGLLEGGEQGHGEVYTPLDTQRIKCGCGKCKPNLICVEAVASTTGMEAITRMFAQDAIRDGSVNMDELSLLLEETRKWNESEMVKRREAGEGSVDLEKSVDAIGAIREHVRGSGLSGADADLLDGVVFDAAVIDSLAAGDAPRVGLACRTMEESGRHLGRYLRSQLTIQGGLKQVILGGGGARTFKRGDRQSNPFWRAMADELEGVDNDPFGVIAEKWIIAYVGSGNLGIQGSKKFAEILYEQGG